MPEDFRDLSLSPVPSLEDDCVENFEDPTSDQDIRIQNKNEKHTIGFVGNKQFDVVDLIITPASDDLEIHDSESEPEHHENRIDEMAAPAIGVKENNLKIRLPARSRSTSIERDGSEVEPTLGFIKRKSDGKFDELQSERYVRHSKNELYEFDDALPKTG